jgi:N-acetylneuraminic acid mutarotase
MEISMRKSAALLLVLVFLTASCLIAAKPAFSSADVAEDTWVAKAPMQVARSGLGVAVVNGKIYAIGGSSRTGAPPYTGGKVGTNEEYDPETDKWTLKASMPTPRYNFRFEVIHNKIYCIGGNTESLSTTQANEVYDPSTDTWETRAPLPTPRESFTTVVYRNRIYVIGGITGSDLAKGVRGTYTGTTEVYDPALDTWETKASMLNARFPETCVVINGKIYVISGSTTYAESISVTAVYDEDTNSWTNKAPMPVVKHGAAVVFDDKIYFIGGSYESSNSPSEDEVFVTRLQIYDPSTDTWSAGALPPYGGVSQGSAFVTTGEMSPIRIYVVDNLLRIYDPKKNEWTLGPNSAVDRFNMGIVVLKDKIYAIGGLTSIWPSGFISPAEPTITTYATNEVYTPVGYGTPDPFYMLATTPPEMSFLSPLNQTYYNSSVSLVFTVDKPVNWMGYSLDGKDNVTITGNTTITGLSAGLHNITVYAKDEFENIGASEPISFSVAEEPEPFPAAPVAAASAATVAVVGVGLLVYFRKRKH